MRQKIIAGNWKMNKNISETQQLINEINEPLNCKVIIAPVFTSLSEAKKNIANKNIFLASQNMHFENSGAFTGEISPLMLKETGCKYVILGHSERRSLFKETDQDINKKVKSALNNELTPILCVGELLEERESNKTNEVICNQVEKSLQGISNNEIKDIIIAYEPVWAIGTGKVATPQQADEAHSVIREKVKQLYSEEIANQVQILYGGSMKPDNANELLSKENVDGGLIGGASLNAKSFNELIKIADEF
jgi:triosephosphate isomerase (TIM)